ncbi:MAG TPA: DUF4350 domain-containing protein [Candidatus Acidoferrales bacterium]|jgi:hypothetical protein|nr:DUF4350 domain-containing protein [Candidatus Acidoferrales bacterium]
MQIALDRADRKLLIVALALMVLLVVATAMLAPPSAAPAPPASSYSVGADGGKATYLLLGELGYKVERWGQPLTELPETSEGAVLILADPFAGVPGRADRESLIRFVRRGGRVLFAGAFASGFLPEAYSSLVKPWEAVERAYPSVAVSPITRGAPQVTMASTVSWVGSIENEIPLYARGAEAVVVTYPVGNGRVIWWASSMPLTNGGITKTGNLDLLLNSLGAPGNAPVLWDEYYHGERRGLTGYLAGTPAPWMLLQAAVVYLFLLLAFGRRTGPVRMPVVESRLSPLEFVETLGALYKSAGAASGAVETVWQRFRYLVCSRLGLPPMAPIRQIFESARERLGWHEPGLFETLQRAERGARDPGISNQEALQIVDSLEHYAGLLRLNRGRSEEKRTWQIK